MVLDSSPRAPVPGGTAAKEAVGTTGLQPALVVVPAVAVPWLWVAAPYPDLGYADLCLLRWILTSLLGLWWRMWWRRRYVLISFKTE